MLIHFTILIFSSGVVHMIHCMSNNDVTDWSPFSMTFFAELAVLSGSPKTKVFSTENVNEDYWCPQIMAVCPFVKLSSDKDPCGSTILLWSKQILYIMVQWVLWSANTVSLVPSSMSRHSHWSCLLIFLYRQQSLSHILSADNLAAAPAQLDQSPLFFVSVRNKAILSNCQLCTMLLESRYSNKTTHHKETHGLMSMGESDLKQMLFRPFRWASSCHGAF